MVVFSLSVLWNSIMVQAEAAQYTADKEIDLEESIP